MAQLESIRSIATRMGLAEEIAAMPTKPPFTPGDNWLPDSMMIRKASEIAVQVHGLQLDLGKQPYIYHCARVAMAMDTPLEQACGWLHDVLEDAEDLEGYAEIIEKEFPACVIVVCETLCRKVGESYAEYIASVALDPLATKIKIADCEDNLRPDRLRLIPWPKRGELQARYEGALKVLRGLTANDRDAVLDR